MRTTEEKSRRGVTLLISSGRTDVGKRRDNNQDNIYLSDSPVGSLPNLYIVADGMGGHAAGDFASRYAIQKVVDFVKTSTVKNPISLLRRAIISANNEVYQEAEKDEAKGGMGTTMVVCVVNGVSTEAENASAQSLISESSSQNESENHTKAELKAKSKKQKAQDNSSDLKLICGNIGDSRLYLINDEIRQITMDHSLVEELIREGQLDRKKGRNHPEKNIITRAMGSREEAVPDFFEVPLRPGDRILLCSDGLSNMVENDEIRDIVREYEDPASAVDALIERANYYGGNDNISAVVISL